MYDALILAGGAARRLGGADKPALVVGGQTLLERALTAVSDACLVVVVGPQRPVRPARPGGAPITWCLENPPGGGPVAALTAGLGRITADTVVVLAADLPWVAPAVPALLDALTTSPEVGLAVLTDATGRVNHLAAAWRRTALVAATGRLGDPSGAAMRLLTASVPAVHVLDPLGWGSDCDTWSDVAVARSATEARSHR